ncbi:MULTISPECIES: JAB N-terminal domain-containing protein [unclassified Frankia]|uniref:JAB N-terminal domain-containing protein n=1 Tax=unclassified Frankia TaxID=2632575 RepID=UPI0020258ABC
MSAGSTEVELYRTDDYVRVGRVPLVPLLQTVFERVLGEALVGSRFELLFLPVADRSELAGSPSVVNLRSSHGYVRVRIVRDGRLLYQHPHSVREIIARPLQRLLAEQIPAEKHWGFGIRGPGFDRVALVRPAPQVEGRVEVTVGSRRPRAFHLEEIHEPGPPAATLADLVADVARTPGADVKISGAEMSGADAEIPDAEIPAEIPDVDVVLPVADRDADTDAGADADAGAGVRAGAMLTATAAPGVTVVIDRDVADALKRRTEFSAEVEEGGFLAGHVYRDADRPGSHLVKITAAIAAERTGASLLHFTFTGESFLRINEQLAGRGRDERLVGWYHTHLFPATGEIGLSSVDVELHTTTFRRLWQVAGLVNIDRDDPRDRVLRFYHAEAADTADTADDGSTTSAPTTSAGDTRGTRSARRTRDGGESMVLTPYWETTG